MRKAIKCGLILWVFYILYNLKNPLPNDDYYRETVEFPKTEPPKNQYPIYKSDTTPYKGNWVDINN